MYNVGIIGVLITVGLWLYDKKYDLENKTLSFGEFKNDLLRNDKIKSIFIVRKLDSFNNP